MSETGPSCRRRDTGEAMTCRFIWNAIDAAEDTDLSILPALTLRSKRLRTATK
jgi:hypothetical protein